MLLTKSLLIAAATSLASLPALADTYRCALSPFEANPSASQGGSPLSEFTFDTATQDNADVAASQDLHAGCVVFRASPELLTCYISDAQQQVSAATADVGSRVLGVMGRVLAAQYQLVCAKR